MTQITLLWITLPFLIGFLLYLLPAFAPFLALGVALLSGGYALQIFLESSSFTLQLLDNFGVTLAIDQLSGFFILTNALVTAAVILYCWRNSQMASLGSSSLATKTAAESHRFFYMQVIILHGSVNATFICADFISLYVALEVISVAAFLLIAYPRTNKAIWVGLRYLFISNTAMLFYLVGVVLVYQTHHSFAFVGLRDSPPEAFALIFMGLLVKGGIFVSGFWLPLTHAESKAPVSAMLSGVVVKAGVFPLVRCALLLEEIEPIVRLFGVGTAILGVLWAIFEKDTKRTLAFSTISQLGFILAAPEVGGFYALTHGLVKSALFLTSGILPSRQFQELQRQPIQTTVWIALVMASFSISGFPLLSGFGAKILTTKNLLPWQFIAMNLATLGTTIVFAKFIFLPHQKDKEQVQPGFWWAMSLLLGGLIAANIVYYEAYTITNIVKPLVTIGIGWLSYLFIFKKLILKLPPALEELEHLIGIMPVMLVVLFWIILTRFPSIALS